MARDREISADVLRDADVSSSPKEHIEFHEAIIIRRSELPRLLSTLSPSDLPPLVRTLVVQFLEVENSYSEAAVKWYATQARFGQGAELRRISTVSRQLYADLEMREIELTKYGWIPIWNAKRRPKPVIDSDEKKPAILDGTQWEYIKRNVLTGYVESSRYGIWFRLGKSKDGVVVADVAARRNRVLPAGADEPNPWLWISQYTYFCKDQRMTETGNRKLTQGYTFTMPEDDVSYPRSIPDNEIPKTVFLVACPQK